MTERFTPGPWEARDCNDIAEGWVIADNWPIHEAQLTVCGQSKFNAHLIAAAPELYDMLSDVVDAMDNYDMECLYKVDKEEIESMLAKARGEHD